MSKWTVSLLALTLSSGVMAFAAEGQVAQVPAAPVAPKVDGTEILHKAGQALFPEDFTANVELTSTRADGTAQVYKMMLYKKGKDKTRADFTYPALEEGRKMLRVGDQIWMYVADLKRPVKMSPKQSLMNSDFNNGDLMRLDFETDYVASILSDDGTTVVLELKARDKSIAYDRILYSVDKKTNRSLKQEFYTASGKLMKTLEFQEWKTYAGFERPSVFVMTNALASNQKSIIKYVAFEAGKTLPEAQFQPDAIAR